LEATVAARTETLSIANRALDETAHQLRSSEDRLRLLFQQTPAGIFVYDREFRVTECNDQFLTLLQATREARTELHLGMLRERDILPAVKAALAGNDGRYEGSCTLTTGAGCACVTLTTVPLWDEKREIHGGIGVAVDISERKRTEAERECLIAELQSALAEVKTLSGLLPMCARCKKIRDDAGYWTQVEEFIGGRTNVQFTHGVCPECCQLLYPDEGE
jgi:PAS domain S-box-containing protein